MSSFSPCSLPDSAKIQSDEVGPLRYTQCDTNTTETAPAYMYSRHYVCIIKVPSPVIQNGGRAVYAILTFSLGPCI